MSNKIVKEPLATDKTLMKLIQAIKDSSLVPECVDNLTSTSIDKPLSANQGRVLNNAIASLMSNIEKVWENPNPSNSFSSQEVAMDLSSCKFAIVIFRESTTLQYEHNLIVRIGGNYAIQSSYQYGPSAIQFVMRGASARTDKVAFTQGYMTLMGTANFTADNTILIPYMVYGIKY